MSDDGSERFARLQQRYQTGDMPWDDELPPPEILTLARTLTPGRAIDLGCGTARASVHLARAGWRVDGVDFVPEAIALAEQRVARAGVGARVRLFRASAAELAFLDEPYDLAVDVGCMHGMAGAELRGYAREVARLVAPGGRYVLFAHLRDQDADEAAIGIARATVFALFRDTFALETDVPGTTDVAGQRWTSAWLYFRRRA